MQNVVSIFIESILIFFAGVVLATLFIWNLVQGIVIQFEGIESITPLVHYFSAWLSGIAAFWLYFRAKQLFHYAKISK